MENPLSSTSSPEGETPTESSAKEMEEPVVNTKPEESTEVTEEQPNTCASPEPIGGTELEEISSPKLNDDGADVMDSIGSPDPGSPYETFSPSASASEDEHPHSTRPKRSAVKLQGITPDGASMYT